MGFELTREQRMAVENHGGSLLVSAAAGSGKTKVLVERLFRHMAEGANVDDFLIITYTKAAAEELRGKIAAELSKRMAREPDNAHLRRQLFRVYQADIRTVDSFCGAVLRENAHLLPSIKGYSFTPDFRVLDEQEAASRKRRVLSRTLETFYQEMDERDKRLAETLGAGRSDEALERLVLNLHEKTQSHPRPMEWLRQMAESWSGEITDLSETPYARSVMADTVQRARFWSLQLRRQAQRLQSWPDLYSACGDRMEEVAEQLLAYEEAARKGWSHMAEIQPAFRRMGRMENGPEKERLQAFVKRCKEELGDMAAVYETTEAEHIADLREMAPAMVALVRLTMRFAENYQTEKARHNRMDFSDQEHYAIDLLTDDAGQPTELARSIAQRYREVMVDEYQDTNAVQNCIFTAVSREEKNLFAVGDVKQSIYRFRLADPTIFLEKYHTYSDAESAQEGEPRRILLSRNFRSRRTVLDSTNFVFRNVLSGEMGEMEYGDDEQLHYGAEYYLPRDDTDTEFHLISVEDTPEESFDRTELEARFVAGRIRRLLDEQYPVQDGDGLRPCQPEDIVILMRSPSRRIKAFTAAMERLHIPCGSGESGGFFDTVEISVIWSFLQIIDNPRQDVPLISVLRSPIFGFTADELAMLRTRQREGDFYEALRQDTGEKTAYFLTVLEELRRAGCEETADKLLWHIYDRVHALAVFGAMPDGEERRNRLIAFYAYAQKQAANGKRRLFDFVSHLRELLERGDVPDLNSRQSGGGVQIMTIHKSKGLEFPIVILCDLQKAFNRQDFDTPVLIHSQMGLGTELVDRERHIRYDTLSKTALKLQLLREAKSEELRVLYVAMTRPQEKLILVDCMRRARKHVQELLEVTSCPVSPEAVRNGKSLGDWILLPLLNTPEASVLREWAGTPVTEMTASDGGWQVFLHHNGDDEAIPAEREQRHLREAPPFDPAPLQWQYAHTLAAVTPSKMTATQLKGRELDEEVREGTAKRPGSVAFPQPRFMQESCGLNSAEKGTAIHLVMQYLPLSLPAADEAVEQTVASLRARHLLTPEQAEAVDVGLIVRFLRSELCGRIRRSGRVYREYRFNLLVDAGIYDASVTGERMMLQGIVDCAFETEDGLVIVDFKTDHITRADVEQRREIYRPQLEAYATALSRVLERPVVEKLLYFFYPGVTAEM